MFDVHYNLYGYEDEYYFDVDQQFSWFDCPVNDTIQWQGHRLDAILDDEFNAIDSTMTCGDIWLRLNPDYPILAYPDDVLNIEYVWTTLDYTVSLYYPNGIKETLSVLYPQEIHFPTSGDGFDYPGYDFAGWFTQPDGAGEQILDGRKYSGIVHDDAIQNLDLYACFVPKTVAVEYWSCTDASPDEMVLVYTANMRLTDRFVYDYDHNHDDDPNNDYLPFNIVGWWNSEWEDIYNQDWIADNGSAPTIQHIADSVDWDGVSPLRVYAETEMRRIEVTYVGGGYEEEHAFDDVRTFF